MRRGGGNHRGYLRARAEVPRFSATLALFPDRDAFEQALLGVGHEPALAKQTARHGGDRGRWAVLIDADKLAPLSWPIASGCWRTN
jgi:hypothetical protein